MISFSGSGVFLPAEWGAPDQKWGSQATQGQRSWRLHGRSRATSLLRLADPRRQGSGSQLSGGSSVELWLRPRRESRDQGWVMVDAPMTRPFLP